MNVGYKHTPYNYKSSTASGMIVSKGPKSTAQLNFLATGLCCEYNMEKWHDDTVERLI